LEILYPIIGKIASKSMIHSQERISMKKKITAEHLSRQASVYEYGPVCCVVWEGGVVRLLPIPIGLVILPRHIVPGYEL
jgi:hypothetical protein